MFSLEDWQKQYCKETNYKLLTIDPITRQLYLDNRRGSYKTFEQWLGSCGCGKWKHEIDAARALWNDLYLKEEETEEDLDIIQSQTDEPD